LVEDNSRSLPGPQGTAQGVLSDLVDRGPAQSVVAV
jgi:hypothetical protein